MHCGQRLGAERAREKVIRGNTLNQKTRQERREERLRKKREKMPQHGKSLARIYRDAILKRLRGKAK
jgi:hypothetical protein